MPASDYRQRLLDRQNNLKLRQQQAADAVTLSEQRLVQARQRFSLISGELKAVTQVVDEQPAADSTPETPAPASSGT